jgi:DNA repair exonuclease SbcCD ATPase subunit
MSQDLRNKYQKLVGKRDSLQDRLSQILSQISSLENEIDTLDYVSSVFRQLLDREVVSSVQSVERLLTEALQAVFTDQDLKVESEVGESRGKVSVNLTTVQDHGGGVIVGGDTTEGFGGAVCTVQSAILRIFVTLNRGLRPLLLMDESLPAFDNNYVQNMGKFLSLLCERLDLDILLVTHNQSLVDSADRAYRIDKKNGKALFTEITHAN